MNFFKGQKHTKKWSMYNTVLVLLNKILKAIKHTSIFKLLFSMRVMVDTIILGF